ncbi:Dcp1-like decapping family protein [Cryptosporidium meleagridis]|uniref:Dcp1-like decapping family protein n=1 Tax=Cryptosporidium meleagridis TaxID=93969 RepID=A0A2P4Z566_9CRYT|nr:Dcp1-like decapping family protein [Cryptosporidium meleagridis]
MNSMENQRKSNLEDERKKLNLQLLKRHDENINEIIAYSSFVSVYLMDGTTQKWVRGEVEGFLHIVKRDIEPIYQLIVLNQKNPENLVLGITSEWELSGETNYLFYKFPNKNNNSLVSCLWFYEVEERKSIEASLKQIVSKLMVKKLNSDIDCNSSSNTGLQPDPTSIYNSNAGKTILEFLNKKSNQKTQEGEINIEQMIRNSVNNNKITQASRIVSDDNIKNNLSNNNNYSNSTSCPDKDNIIINVESKSNSEKTVVNDSLKKLLHFQDILGKGSKVENKNNRKNENITPEAITDIIMDVLSSRQVYNMINERIELLLRK